MRLAFTTIFGFHTGYDEFNRITSAPEAARSSAYEGASAE